MPLVTGLLLLTALLTPNVWGFSHSGQFSGSSRVSCDSLHSDSDFQSQCSPHQMRPSPTFASAGPPILLTDRRQIRGSHGLLLKFDNLLEALTELREHVPVTGFLSRTQLNNSETGERHRAGVSGGRPEPPSPREPPSSWEPPFLGATPSPWEHPTPGSIFSLGAAPPCVSNPEAL